MGRFVTKLVTRALLAVLALSLMGYGSHLLLPQAAHAVQENSYSMMDGTSGKHQAMAFHLQLPEDLVGDFIAYVTGADSQGPVQAHGKRF